MPDTNQSKYNLVSIFVLLIITILVLLMSKSFYDLDKEKHEYEKGRTNNIQATPNQRRVRTTKENLLKLRRHLHNFDESKQRLKDLCTDCCEHITVMRENNCNVYFEEEAPERGGFIVKRLPDRETSSVIYLAQINIPKLLDLESSKLKNRPLFKYERKILTLDDPIWEEDPTKW